MSIIYNLVVSLPSLVRFTVISVNIRSRCGDASGRCTGSCLRPVLVANASATPMISEWLAHEHSRLRRAHELALIIIVIVYIFCSSPREAKRKALQPQILVLLPDEIRRLEGISIKQPFQLHNRVNVGSLLATWMRVYRYMRPRTGSRGDA